MNRLKDKNMRLAYRLAEIKLLSSIDSSPETLSEKIRFKMAYDRNPKLTMFADKYQVRKHVRKRLGPEYLIPLYYSGKKGKDIFKLQVDSDYVIKANHGCGGIIFVSKDVETDSELIHTEGIDWRVLQVKPDNLSFTVVGEIIDKWMNQNYSYLHGEFVEWAYRDIKPRFLVEELMEDVNGGTLIDYKFFVINGKCQFIEIHTDRFKNHGKGFYSLDWSRLEMTQTNVETSESIPKPQELQKMIEIAEILAKGADFLRVDLYLTKKGIKFGELTNYPGAGNLNFSPEFWNSEMGKEWVPKY